MQNSSLSFESKYNFISLQSANTFQMNLKRVLKILGPGLLFASSSIGTSHLVLSTRAGAHHGLIFFWIILACLLLKYPFFEFAPRYVAATGHSLLKGYEKQGRWAIVLFILIICISMFAVTGAVGAVSAGILSTIGNVQQLGMPLLTAIVLGFTALLLYVGGYRALDTFVKWLSVILLVSVLFAFLAVVLKGPVERVEGFQPTSLLQGAGLALLISLLGWMPTGLEASVMHSFWVLEKEKANNKRTTLKDSLFDFNLGYGMTVLLALLFMIIGAFTIYGSGNLLDGSSTEFSKKLLDIFSTNIGQWSGPIIIIAAFGTIYGTLITAWDAFARSFVRGMRIFRFETIEHTSEQNLFIEKYYPPVMLMIGLGGYLLFRFASSNMITILQGATIFSFIAGPILAYLNLKAIQSNDVGEEFRAERWKIILAWIGLIAMIAFGAYYIYTLLVHGAPGH